MNTSEKVNAWFPIGRFNKVIKVLIISDIIILSSFGLMSPIFAIFVTKSIIGGTVAVAGIASAVFFISKSLFQLPSAYLVDRIKGEKDDFWAMFLGSVLFSLVPLLYLIIDRPWELYVVQFVLGLATGVALPSWFAIFTRHIDKKHEGVEWGLYKTLVDFGSAISASVGGFLAYKFGFAYVFILVSVFSFTGAMVLVLVHKNMKTGKIFFLPKV